MNIETWILFFTTCMVAALAPGPSIVAIIKESATNGLKRSLPMMAGVLAGLIILGSLAGLGLAVVLEKSETLFTILRYIGGAYLFYMGVQAFFFSKESVQFDIIPEKKHSLFFKGFALTLSNPKALAYFSALFVPFIDKSRNYHLQFVILMFTMVACSVVSLLFYGIMSQKANEYIRNYSKIFNRVTGAIFMVFSLFVITDR